MKRLDGVNHAYALHVPLPHTHLSRYRAPALAVLLGTVLKRSYAPHPRQILRLATAGGTRLRLLGLLNNAAPVGLLGEPLPLASQFQPSGLVIVALGIRGQGQTLRRPLAVLFGTVLRHCYAVPEWFRRAAN
ncbi:MAG: hypothetical protein QOC72_1548 [Methylobacteriaceae bacterium]|nr:hypothetical protein [Methylobacteriaceae bacterium]